MRTFLAMVLMSTASGVASAETAAVGTAFVGTCFLADQEITPLGDFVLPIVDSESCPNKEFNFTVIGHDGVLKDMLVHVEYQASNNSTKIMFGDAEDGFQNDSRTYGVHVGTTFQSEVKVGKTTRVGCRGQIVAMP